MSDKLVKVYFGSMQHGRPDVSASFAAKVDHIADLMLSEIKIEKKDKVAIKMHLGFNDGYQTIPVFFIRRIVDKIKDKGAYPFITDNPTSVYNAYKRGYTQETCGCPLIPVAGVKDGYVTSVDVNYRGVEKLELGGALIDADVLIDISHAKGHGACGYGGAIKNLALGAYSGPSRWHKIHGVVSSVPYWDKEKGSAELAKKLVASCPYNALSYKEEKNELNRNFHDCKQCMLCVELDHGAGIVKLPRESFSAFQEFMAIATKKVLDTFSADKIYYLNFLMEITMYCDCFGIGQMPIVNDIGILGSKDIVAIETATLDLIKKEGLLVQNIPPYVKNPNLDLEADIHPFTRVHGPYKDPYETVDFAENLGLGTSKYELIEILSPEETAQQEPPKRVFEGQPTFF